MSNELGYSSGLGKKIQRKLDTYAPGVTLDALRRQLKKGKLNNAMARLFDLAESENEGVALSAIKEIVRLTGYDSLMGYAMKAMAERYLGGPGAEDDPEEIEARKHLDNVVSRRTAAPASRPPKRKPPEA